MMRFRVILAFLVFVCALASPASDIERNTVKHGKKDSSVDGEAKFAVEKNDIVLDVIKIGVPAVGVVVLILIEAWIIKKCMRARRSKDKEADVEGQWVFQTQSPTTYRTEIETKPRPSVNQKKKRSHRKSRSTSVHSRKKKLLKKSRRKQSYSVQNPKRKTSNIKSGSTSVRNLNSKTHVKKDYCKIIVDKEKEQLKTDLQILKNELNSTVKQLKVELSVLTQKAKEEQRLREWSGLLRASQNVKKAASSSRFVSPPSSSGSGVNTYRELSKHGKRSVGVVPAPLLPSPPSPPPPTLGYDSSRAFVGVKQTFLLSCLDFKNAIKQRQIINNNL